jgi:hypothetical protein
MSLILEVEMWTATLHMGRVTIAIHIGFASYPYIEI